MYTEFRIIKVSAIADTYTAGYEPRVGEIVDEINACYRAGSVLEDVIFTTRDYFEAVDKFLDSLKKAKTSYFTCDFLVESVLRADGYLLEAYHIDDNGLEEDKDVLKEYFNNGIIEERMDEDTEKAIENLKRAIWAIKDSNLRLEDIIDHSKDEEHKKRIREHIERNKSEISLLREQKLFYMELPEKYTNVKKEA